MYTLDNARRTAEKGMCWVVMECNMCNMCNIQSMIEIFNQGLGNGCNICINEGAVMVKWNLKWYPESKSSRACNVGNMCNMVISEPRVKIKQGM